AEDKRAEIVNGSHAANVVREDGFRVELHIFTALWGCLRFAYSLSIHARSGNAAVNHAKIVEIEERVFTRAGAEAFLQRPTALGEIFAAKSGVHAAIDGPVKGIANHCALGA